MQVLQAVYSSLSASLHQKWSLLLESHSATAHLQEGFYEKRLMLYICRGICEGFTTELWAKILKKMLFCSSGQLIIVAKRIFCWRSSLAAMCYNENRHAGCFFCCCLFFVALHVAVFNVQALQKDFHAREVHFPPSVSTLSGQWECTALTPPPGPYFSNLSQPISPITLTEIKTC